MRFAHGVAAIVERPSGTDLDGNPLTPTTHALEDCGRAPGGSTEDNDQGETVTWDISLMCDHDDDIEAEDVVTFPDDAPLPATGEAPRYQVHGNPKVLRSPLTGWKAGKIARLKAVRG